MKSELLNEFYLLQQSRAPYDYREVLDEQVYLPIKKANHKMSSWISRRGKMLLNLDVKLNSSMKHLRKKYLKF
ncbi:hypothetical protein [Pedobacter caeni]|uniref:Uncharacterized protein n=1 Tax=Pedobacter caeni TaxID=288992 RepID=A0A1M5F6Q6_9SPHI|nr:hypothetical protein [Pedobacter caeni]SHF87233.1 hypothetical protein SAMN04488522_103959 [Pedobacter caeni]